MVAKGIIFGKGFLGTRLAEYLGYDSTTLNPLNRENLSRFLDAENPSVVVNAIGKTGRPNIDWCEEHKEETMLSNVNAAIALSAECSKRGIYFAHLGSGCIYDGDNQGKGFSESDDPNFWGPQFYAKTKILAEKALTQFPGLILRIRMPIDNRPHPRNLIDKLAGYSRVIEVANSMTTVPFMLEATKELIEMKADGTYNLVNSGTISAYEIMEMYQRIVDVSHTFEKLSREGLNGITLGRRSNCVLRTDKLENEGIHVPGIKESVEACLKQYKKSKS